MEEGGALINCSVKTQQPEPVCIPSAYIFCPFFVFNSDSRPNFWWRMWFYVYWVFRLWYLYCFKHYSKTEKSCAWKFQLLDFEFDVDKVVSKVIVKSEPMRDTFADLDSSSDAVEIAFDINPPRMRLSTDGELGQIETVFPGSSDLVEKFDCVAKQQNKSVRPLSIVPGCCIY